MKRQGFGGLLMFDARGYHEDARAAAGEPDGVHEPASGGGCSDSRWHEAERLGLQVSVNLSSCAGALKGPWDVGDDAPEEAASGRPPKCAARGG